MNLNINSGIKLQIRYSLCIDLNCCLYMRCIHQSIIRMSKQNFSHNTLQDMMKNMNSQIKKNNNYLCMKYSLTLKKNCNFNMYKNNFCIFYVNYHNISLMGRSPNTDYLTIPQVIDNLRILLRMIQSKISKKNDMDTYLSKYQIISHRYNNMSSIFLHIDNPKVYRAYHNLCIKNNNRNFHTLNSIFCTLSSMC